MKKPPVNSDGSVRRRWNKPDRAETFTVIAQELLIHKYHVQAKSLADAREEALRGCPLPDGECDSVSFEPQSINGGRPHGALTFLEFTYDEWTEISEALASKIWAIKHGVYGAEIEPDEDNKWCKDLVELRNRIMRAVQL